MGLHDCANGLVSGSGLEQSLIDVGPLSIGPLLAIEGAARLAGRQRTELGNAKLRS